MLEIMRVQKYLSRSGVCSRRKAEEYIKKGFILINGKKAEIGQSITVGKDEVKIKDQVVEEQENFVYYKFNKPRGIETTCAQKGGKSIIDIIDIKERIFPIGRLDKESTGLILLTNDGRIANFLMHPRYEHEKEYFVETFGPVSDEELEEMEKGVMVLGKMTNRAPIKRVASGKFSIILTEGKNRQIRRMVEEVGGKVKKLKRIRIENIELGKLKEGALKHLSKVEYSELFKTLGIDKVTKI